ncbi:peptidase S66, LD-carboxypeptidase A [Marasmius fiardii PR-910]|nr:peptidase S66, LD-carboxypeptidase A [Marasmius fiardii PR-910]
MTLTTAITAARPPPVNAGDSIRIIAPAGAVTAASLAAGTKLLASAPWNLQARRDLDVLLAVDFYYAGSDDLRTTSLLEAVSEATAGCGRSNETKAIWAARGGYGTARLLARLQDTVIPALQANPRWLVGYSDLTALIALWNRANVLALHGPMASDIQSFTQAARDETLAIIRGTAAYKQTFKGSIRYRGNSGSSSVRGRLLGGNLSVLASLVGSGFLPSFQGAILFIEDTGEAAYRLDRYLTTLLRSQDFAGIVGIAMGQFVDGDTSSYTALELLDFTLAPLGLPVLTGLPVGHDTTTAMPLVLGAEAEIDLNIGQLTIDVPASS